MCTMYLQHTSCVNLPLGDNVGHGAIHDAPGAALPPQQADTFCWGKIGMCASTMQRLMMYSRWVCLRCAGHPVYVQDETTCTINSQVMVQHLCNGLGCMDIVEYLNMHARSPPTAPNPSNAPTPASHPGHQQRHTPPQHRRAGTPFCHTPEVCHSFYGVCLNHHDRKRKGCTQLL